ncbi:hypothetical protein T10_12425 [Trichinella papuae]|uniref:Uncharacterized protein n=1 Tax=Trichinella papuae TaxID=268474 RepID=A0A0V1M3S0_9BILA|nr:hypothetical protein T10_12425 [Trichinella papuae]
MEKKGRSMLLEDRRKREKDGEDFLEENEPMPEKKLPLLARGKRHGKGKMVRTWPGFKSSRVLGKYGSGADKKWQKENGTGLQKKGRSLLWENSRKRLKQGEDFLEENDSIPEKKLPDVNRAQLLEKYGSGTDKKWQSWLWENITNQEKEKAEFFEGKRFLTKQMRAQKQQKEGEDFPSENASDPVEKRRSFLQTTLHAFFPPHQRYPSHFTGPETVFSSRTLHAFFPPQCRFLPSNSSTILSGRVLFFHIYFSTLLDHPCSFLHTKFQPPAFCPARVGFSPNNLVRFFPSRAVFISSTLATVSPSLRQPPYHLIKRAAVFTQQICTLLTPTVTFPPYQIPPTRILSGLRRIYPSNIVRFYSIPVPLSSHQLSTKRHRGAKKAWKDIGYKTARRKARRERSYGGNQHLAGQKETELLGYELHMALQNGRNSLLLMAENGTGTNRKRGLDCLITRQSCKEMEESFLTENDSELVKNHAQFLGKYGSRTDKKWQSWLWENSTKQVKGLEENGRNLLWENSRKRKVNGEDFLVENEWIPEKKHA